MTTPTGPAAIVNATLSIEDDLEHEDGSPVRLPRRVRFDAGPYLRQASIEQILALADEGFGVSRATGRVAAWTAEQVDRVAQDLRDVLAMLDAYPETRYMVILDESQAAEFIATHRPEAPLWEITRNLMSQEASGSPWGTGTDRIGDLTREIVRREIESTFYTIPDDLLDRITDHMCGLVYRIAFTLGPDLPIAMLHGQPQAALHQSARRAERAALYQAAGLTVREARDREAGPRRPTDDALRTLAALRGTVGA